MGKEPEMILLTTLKGEQIAINDDLIERVEADPETRVVLTNGTCYIVAESVGEVARLSQVSQAEVHVLARRMMSQLAATGDLDWDRTDAHVLPFDRRDAPQGK